MCLKKITSIQEPYKVYRERIEEILPCVEELGGRCKGELKSWALLYLRADASISNEDASYYEIPDSPFNIGSSIYFNLTKNNKDLWFVFVSLVAFKYMQKKKLPEVKRELREGERNIEIIVLQNKAQRFISGAIGTGSGYSIVDSRIISSTGTSGTLITDLGVNLTQWQYVNHLLEEWGDDYKSTLEELSGLVGNKVRLTCTNPRDRVTVDIERIKRKYEEINKESANIISKLLQLRDITETENPQEHRAKLELSTRSGLRLNELADYAKEEVNTLDRKKWYDLAYEEIVFQVFLRRGYSKRDHAFIENIFLGALNVSKVSLEVYVSGLNVFSSTLMSVLKEQSHPHIAITKGTYFQMMSAIEYIRMLNPEITITYIGSNEERKADLYKIETVQGDRSTPITVLITEPIIPVNSFMTNRHDHEVQNILDSIRRSGMSVTEDAVALVDVTLVPLLDKGQEKIIKQFQEESKKRGVVLFRSLKFGDGGVCKYSAGMGLFYNLSTEVIQNTEPLTEKEGLFQLETHILYTSTEVLSKYHENQIQCAKRVYEAYQKAKEENKKGSINIYWRKNSTLIFIALTKDQELQKREFFKQKIRESAKSQGLNLLYRTSFGYAMTTVDPMGYIRIHVGSLSKKEEEALVRLLVEVSEVEVKSCTELTEKSGVFRVEKDKESDKESDGEKEYDAIDEGINWI